MKQYKVILNEAQQGQLEAIVNKGKHSTHEIKRARVLLLLNQGNTLNHTAWIAGVCKATVSNIKARFLESKQAIELALTDKPRPGQPRKVTAEVEAHITAIACSHPPEGRQRWTLELIRDKLISLQWVGSISDEAIRLSLKKASSSPGKKSNGVLAR